MTAPSNYLPISRPLLGDEEWAALKEPLTSGWLTQGPKVKEFEDAFAARHQVRHALAATSCTTALHLALLALGVGPGDTVVVPSFTWVATANAVEYCGARPVFVDNRREDYNLDPNRLEETLNRLKDRGENPKALIAVHLFGLMADMEAVAQLAERFDLAVVEDAACAAGASLGGRMAGAWGRVGCFSFHPRKIITTGEGGMCTTNDGQLAERIAALRSHGGSISEERRQSGDSPFLLPEFNMLGFNYRLSDLQGAVGLTQLRKLDGFIAERRRLAAVYDQALEGLSDLIAIPSTPAGYEHSYQAYVCLLKAASPASAEIMHGLHQKGIGSRPGTHAIHELGFYRQKYGFAPADFPGASELAGRTLALPLFNGMAEDAPKRVAEALEPLLKKGR